LSIFTLLNRKNMKKSNIIATIILSTLLISYSPPLTADSNWNGNKFSMFIHYGLYSELGGKWNGKEIHTGYSEQIQAHAGIYGDVYADLAYEFNPAYFNADSIASLAKRAGMRSIVITSKHHDGFCLWHTATTDFNSYDSPAGRDLVAELSQACKKAGLNFGLYFSLIDWHAPCADHITSHNTTFITEEHHALNMAQVKELTTLYGPVSELWFDMGSLTPEQSKELYDLVHKNQKDCMVSGRLGNGYYDFAVMSDNFYPESSLQTQWQSAASMFDETWGYRSWQKRGDPRQKSDEKLRSLIRVVSGGGNFLLNIGPMGDGRVVPFEKQVLEMMGSWLSENGDVIYNTEPSPFLSPFDWGAATCKGNRLNLILSGNCPENGVILLPAKDNSIVSVSGPADASINDGKLKVSLKGNAYAGDIKVIRIVLRNEIKKEESVVTGKRIARSSYFCQDYYTNHRSETGYVWNIQSNRRTSSITFSHTGSDSGKRVKIDVDDDSYELILGSESSTSLSCKGLEEKERFVAKVSEMVFDNPKTHVLNSDSLSVPVDTLRHETKCKTFETIYVEETITSPSDRKVLLEVGGGNGVELIVNGESVMKHLNPYRCTFRSEKVLVNLVKGENRIVLRSYNRFEKIISWMLRISPDQTLYNTTLYLEKTLDRGLHKIAISSADAVSPHADCELHNLVYLENR